jgi:hypothetical protein
MAPLAKHKLCVSGVSGVSDNIAAWTLRGKVLLVFGQGNNFSIGATVEKRDLSNIKFAVCKPWA